MLAGYGVTSSVPVAHSIRHPGFWPFIPLPWRVQRFPLCLSDGPKNLPIHFEVQAMVVQPFLHKATELFQFPLVRPEYGDVVHVPDIM